MFFLACIYQPFGAITHSDALGLLADFLLPVLRVLAVIPITVFATHEGQSRKG
jgi:hypothetical protein